MVKKEQKAFVKVQNVVVSADIHAKLNLNFLVSKLDDIQYNPETFPGAIYKLGKLNASFLLFDTGRVICTGTKSLKEVNDALAELIKRLKRLKIKVKGKPDVRVTNMVASGALGGVLNLNKLLFALEDTEYEPEQFPGLVYHLPGSSITFLLFSTGKIVVAGAKNSREINESLKDLVAQLKKKGELK